ncbi:phage tail protein [Corynebacterium pseudodiphtheriticum]|uniref:phage tail tube protein n=1 Tax=Corynebacterium pseudodiphtheriticum TaxID=37637 RepID=UPI0020C0EE0F|nr:phage tail protein [Corynebacterium pseudodiphtheriticum]UQV56385.1 phage tail protein [Corynebacterium pseudodiphtheriticum]
MFNDSAVFTAAMGYVYTAPVGTPAPTPEQLKKFDADTFGLPEFSVRVTGTGKFTLSSKSKTTEQLDAKASTAAEVQAALNKVVTDAQFVVSGGTGNFNVSVSAKGEVGANFLTGTGVGGSAPTVAVSRTSEGAVWDPIGHTGVDDLPEFGYEGGDTESKGTWQKKAFKEITTEAPVDYVTVKALQFDPATMELYYGKNASAEEGVFGVENPGQNTAERAVLIVMVDGEFKIGFSAAKASIRRDESISLSGEDFSTLPLRATFVKHPGRHLFEWTTPAK